MKKTILSLLLVFTCVGLFAAIQTGPPTTSSGGGSSSSQTPWTNNQNAVNFALSNAYIQNIIVSSTNSYDPAPLLLTGTAGQNFFTVSGGAVTAFTLGDEITVNGNQQYWIVDVTNSPASFTIYPQIASSVTNTTNWHVFPCTLKILDDVPRIVGGWNGDASLFISGLYGSQQNSGRIFFANGIKTWQMGEYDDSTGVAFVMGGLLDSKLEIVHIYYDAPNNSLDVAHNGAFAPNNGITNEIGPSVPFHLLATMPSLVVTNTATIATVNGVTVNAGSATVTNTITAATVNAVAVNAGSETVTNTLTSATGNVATGNIGILTITNNIASIAGSTTAGLLGTPAIVATVALTAQSASIASTVLYSNNTGLGRLFRLAGVAQITTLGAVSGSLTVSVTSTNAIGAKTYSMLNGAVANATATAEYPLPEITSQTTLDGTEPFQYFFVASGATVKYSTTYAGGTGAAMRYSLNLILERLQ